MMSNDAATKFSWTPAALVDAARLGFAVLGCSLVGIGCGLYWLPLGFMVPGAMLFTVSLIGSMRSKT